MAGEQHWPEGAALAEWKRHWPLVITSMFSFSLVAMGSVSFGAFLQPLQAAFHWTRVEATYGLLLYSLVSIVGQPVVGRMIDRFGPRPIALAGIVAGGITFALLGTATSSVALWIGLWLLYSLAAQMMLMPVWMAAVASEFEAGRGLALAGTLSGSALSTLVAPVIATLLIEDYGWRTAYAVMGLVPSSVVFVFAWRFFRSRADEARSSRDAATPGVPVLTGLTVREGVRSPTFYKLLFGTLIAYTLMVGTLLHMIPILTSSGLSPVQAAIVAGSLGLTTVLGKLICGLLVNRVPGHLISAAALVLPVITFSALMVPSDSVVLRTLAVTPLGLALGGQMKMVVYMTTRYFGLRAFGSIFGFITIGLTVSSSAGPFLTSYLYDLAHDYHLVPTAGIPLALLGSLVMLSIGGYPDLARTGSGEAAIAGGKA